MGRSLTPAEARDERLKRLAAKIDALLDKDEASLRRSREIRALRRSASAELYSICSTFVNSLNRLVSRGEVMLDPSEYNADAFHEDAANLIQVNVRGRILQVEFEATLDLISSEDFRIPYTLQGYVRAFNQELLDKDVIEEHLIFFTLEEDRSMWRFFDPRTYRSGVFEEEYLVTLLEQVLK